jgi:hypothetical protein
MVIHMMEIINAPKSKVKAFTPMQMEQKSFGNMKEGNYKKVVFCQRVKPPI